MRGFTYLDLLESRAEPRLLVIAGKLGVLVDDLVLKLVDHALEVVLLVLGVLNELILHDHGILTLGLDIPGGLVERSCACGQREIALPLLLLHLAHLRRLLLLVNVHLQSIR